MSFTRLYYRIKPFLPRTLRFRLRRWRAARIRKTCGSLWPIRNSAGQPPPDWPGWPDGKKFALVLTHDVEGQAGVDQTLQMTAIEKDLGFRSSVNFIPEGSYSVPASLRHSLTDAGFEVGVHDLNHDGHLYDSRDDFARKAERINHYLQDWGAVGFRSGFMLRRLEWLHDLNCTYDASTFDTDPFEPQPQGANTIFPFFVSDGRGGSYVELPYTLAQDSTLFLILDEQSPALWKKKLDWIVEHGGMALVNVHPDYMCFDGTPGFGTYPAGFYEEFLRYVKTRYGDVFWNALPREVAARMNALRPASLTEPSTAHDPLQSRGKIWIDLENTPHIPFFRPLLRELKKRGYEVALSARDSYQTCEMADLFGLEYEKIGHHYGKNKARKLWGLFARSAQLLPFARRERPQLSLNLGSRTQSTLSAILGIPTVSIMDYEHTSSLPLLQSQWQICPEIIPSRGPRILQYAGIKEDVYVPDFRPDPSLATTLGLGADQIIVTVRPPATEAHYHNPEAEVLFTRFMDRASATPGVKCILLPRNKRQEEEIRAHSPHWFEGARTVIPEGVVDGLNLLWHSDLVVSGGGTMNREAAAMGIPVFSIFRGTPGAVDLQLQKESRLTMIASPAEVDTLIPLVSRPGKDAPPDAEPRQALKDIIAHIEHILAIHYPAADA